MILSEANDRFVPTPTLELLSPLICEISRAAGTAALEQSSQAAIELLGFHYFVFISGLSRSPDEPFRPVLATLPKHICDTFVENESYKANPILDQIRQTGRGLAFELSGLPDTPTVAKVRAMFAPLGITSAALVPVISATDKLSVFGAYRRGGAAPGADVLDTLAMVGAAISLRMLTLFSREPHSPLTEAQRDILKWAAAGKSAGDIAVIMGLSRRGCEYHLGEIYRKLGVTSRSQAVAAYARGAA